MTCGQPARAVELPGLLFSGGGCVCVYACMHGCVHACVRAWVRVYACMCMCVCAYACVCVRACVWVDSDAPPAACESAGRLVFQTCSSCCVQTQAPRAGTRSHQDREAGAFRGVGGGWGQPTGTGLGPATCVSDECQESGAGVRALDLSADLRTPAPPLLPHCRPSPARPAHSLPPASSLCLRSPVT